MFKNFLFHVIRNSTQVIPIFSRKASRYINETRNERLQQYFTGFKSGNLVFEVPYQSIEKVIKLRMVGKIFNLEFIDLISNIIKTSNDPNTKELYSKRLFELVSFLVQTSTDMPSDAKKQILNSLADSSPKNLLETCSNMTKFVPWHQYFGLSSVKELLIKSYKQNNIQTAMDLVDRFGDLIITTYTMPSFFSSLSEESQLSKMPKQTKNLYIKHLRDLIKSCQRLGLHPAYEDPKQIAKIIKSLGINIKERTNVYKGRCSSCNKQLPKYDGINLNMVINSEIHRSLSTTVISRNDETMINTTNDELDKFREYLTLINKKSPIDLVIDALNLAYLSQKGIAYKPQHQVYQGGTKMHRVRVVVTQVLEKELIRAIEIAGYSKKFKNILVVGKQHMRSWSNLGNFLDTNSINFYTLANTSTDDLFLLYAATLNPETYLVSNDLYRDHQNLIENPMVRDLIVRWRDSRQIWTIKHTLIPIYPDDCERIPNIDEMTQTFHIPLTNDKINKNNFKDILFDGHNSLNRGLTEWVCCEYPPLE